MSLGEAATPGAVQRVAVAVVRGESQFVVASDETVLDGYPDEPVWTEQQLDAERVSLELRLTPIFRD